MKRTLLFFAIISITYSMHAQWKYKEINNPFDGVTRKVFIKGKAIGSSSYNPTLIITKSFKTNTIDIQIKDANKLTTFFVPGILFKVDGGDDSIYFQSAHEYDHNTFELKKGTWTIPDEKINQLLDLIKNNYKLYVRLFNITKIDDYEFSLKDSAKAIQYLMEKN